MKSPLLIATHFSLNIKEYCKYHDLGDFLQLMALFKIIFTLLTDRSEFAD